MLSACIVQVLSPLRSHHNDNGCFSFCRAIMRLTTPSNGDRGKSNEGKEGRLKYHIPKVLCQTMKEPKESRYCSPKTQERKG